MGNLGGFVGPTVVGWLRRGSLSYTTGLLVLAAVLVLEASLVSTIRLGRPKEGAALPSPDLGRVPAR